MRHIFGSLVVRIGLVFLLGLVVLQGVVAVALLWPDGRPTIFRLISPYGAVAIARALEVSSGEQRSRFLAAMNAGPVTVHMLPDFPADTIQGGANDAPYLKKLYGGYAYVLEG
ncbi:MAG TPA: hypothetical protein VHZ32_14845, partial [Rhizomicrobium sp.]|nr:hypothetical protein [Rhizomicrobium sp.]